MSNIDFSKLVMGNAKMRALKPAAVALSNRQLRLALMKLGKLDAVEAAIEALPDTERDTMRIEWDFSTEFQLSHPIMGTIFPLLDMVDDDLEHFWQTAAHY